MSPPLGYRYSAEEIGYILRRRRRSATAKARRKYGSLLSFFFVFLVEHQMGLSVTLIAMLCLFHALYPEERHHTRKFYQLSHYDSSSQTYAPGRDDFPFVVCWVTIFMAMRSAVMDYVLKPLAIRGGVHRKKAIQRFSEQGWLVIYYLVSFGIGLWLWANSKYWLNFRELWTDFPHPTMSRMMKWYYLVQFAFWLQQIIVVNMERQRKDYWQMLIHHIVTCTLLFTSYCFYMTRVGNVVLCLMDVADIVLSSAKVLRYLGYRTACDVAFGVFIATWFITRHVLYPLVCWSVWADLPEEMPLGCYEGASGRKSSQNKGSHISHYLQPFYDPGGIICFDTRVHFHFLGLLISLECIIMVWFGMIIRVAWRVVKGLGADDTRSDDEDEEEGIEATVPSGI